MEIGEVRSAAMLPEWQRRICECRNSGQPVKKWCEDHHISVKTYYRWERLCIAQATSKTEESSALNLVRIQPEVLPTAEIASSVMLQHITIRSGDVSIELANGASADQIAQLVKALNHA